MKSHTRFRSMLLVILVILCSSVTIGDAAMLTNGHSNVQIDTWFNQTLAHANISQYEKDQIRQEYIYYQTAQTAIATKQQALAAHPIAPKSAENKRVISDAFRVDSNSAPGTIPQGGIIQYTEEGKTRVYDPQNKELYVAVDNESGTITTPSGDTIPATHLISVPSGSSIYTVGNKDYVTNQGNVILTIVNPTIGTASTETNTLMPSTISDSWVDWAQTDTGNIGLLSSTWQLPSNPSEDTASNIIWNGIQPADGSGILQPVTGFDYSGNNAANWKNQWTGNVWFGLNNYYVTTQNSIALTTGDMVTGTVIKLPWSNRWWVSLSDISSGKNVQNETDLSTYFPPQNVQAVNVFEAYPRYTRGNLNGISQYYWLPLRERYTDSMKPSSDVTFLNTITGPNFNPVSLQWSENYNPLGHPTIKNLDMDITNLGSVSVVQMHMNSASKPSHAITLTESPTGGGIISPNETINVPYEYTETIPVTITPNSGYLIDNVTVDGVSQGAITSYPFSNDHQDHTLVANFKQNLPAIVPLCQAGTPFDASVYPQNTPQSNPMTFTCNWDGNGRVYISGSNTSLTGVYADDGFTITIQPNGTTFDAAEHWAHQHPILELTSGMTPGSNTMTLIVRNWMGLSMHYGSKTGTGIDQTPWIIEVNTPSGSTSAVSATAAKVSSTSLPSFITINGTELVVNGTPMGTTTSTDL